MENRSVTQPTAVASYSRIRCCGVTVGSGQSVTPIHTNGLAAEPTKFICSTLAGSQSVKTERQQDLGDGCEAIRRVLHLVAEVENRGAECVEGRFVAAPRSRIDGK